MKIDQTLHGYYKGHGLLASSISSLTSDDLSKMSVLSDWTGYHVKDGGEDAYITTYPLSDKQYVFAKTWYASEMNRPGCVWTHSFIINLEMLDKEFDFRQLYTYFRRPLNLNVSSYSEPLNIKFKLGFDSSRVFKTFDEVTIMFFYLYLIQKQKQLRISIENKQSDYISLILLLLQYLPIDTLYQTSVSSGANNIIMYGNNDFSLQYVDGTIGLSLKEFGLSDKLKPTDFAESIQYLKDSAKDYNDELPSLIKMFHEDILDSSVKLNALLLLMKSLDYKLHGKNTNTTFKDILELLHSYFPTETEGKDLKNSFLGKKISTLFNAEPIVLYDIAACQTLDSFSNEIHQFENRLDELEKRSQNDFQVLFERVCGLSSYNRYAQLIIREGINALPITIVNKIIQRCWNTLSSILLSNSGFLVSGKWVLLNSAIFQSFINSFNSAFEFRNLRYWNELIDKILGESIQINTLISKIIVLNAPNAISKIFDALNNPELEVSETFLNYCFIDQEQVFAWIMEQQKLSQNVVDAIVNNIDPNAEIVKSHSSSIWIPLVNADNGKMELEYYVFLYLLNFNGTSALTQILIEHSYQHIYKALEQNNMPCHLWKKIEKFTKKLSKSNEWDKCKKLRKGLAIYLKSNGYSKETIEKFDITKNYKESLLKSL